MTPALRALFIGPVTYSSARQRSTPVVRIRLQTTEYLVTETGRPKCWDSDEQREGPVPTTLGRQGITWVRDRVDCLLEIARGIDPNLCGEAREEAQLRGWTDQQPTQPSNGRALAAKLVGPSASKPQTHPMMMGKRQNRLHQANPRFQLTAGHRPQLVRPTFSPP